MRALRLMFTVISISIICILCCSLVSALNLNEASVMLFWESQPVKVGDRATVWIAFGSECDEQLEIHYVGLNFDWMPPDSFYGLDLSDDPVTIPSYGTYTFDKMIVQIPLDISAGAHRYFIGIEGTQGALASSFSWSSSISTVQISASDEKVYSDLLSQVVSKINEADSANYESAEAQSLLQQAKDERTVAQTSALEGRLQEAISSLENASSFLDQAEAAEQLHAEQKAQLQQLLLYIAVIVIAVVVVAVIAVIWRKRRKMKPKVKRPPLKEELTISGVTFSGGDTVDVVVDNSGKKDFAIAEVWINNEKQVFTTTPPMERIPPNESVHVSLTYAYSKGTSYNVKIVSDRKKIYLVSTTAL